MSDTESIDKYICCGDVLFVVVLNHRNLNMKTTMYMEDELYIKVKEHCEENGATVSGLIRSLLKKRLKGDI